MADDFKDPFWDDVIGDPEVLKAMEALCTKLLEYEPSEMGDSPINIVVNLNKRPGEGRIIALIYPVSTDYDYGDGDIP